MDKKILICEDEREIRELLSAILKKNRFEVYTTEDGEKAIEKAKEIEPDLILLDIRMPKLDGLEVAKEIRKFNTDAKIIFITAFQSLELSKEAAKYNIVDYLVKPITAENIVNAVSNALEQ